MINTSAYFVNFATEPTIPCGQEDQLGALGLILNMIVYWNALYIEETVRQLNIEGFEVSDADIDKVFTFTF
ncbi:Tn3 family transposase [Shewanella psychropiezotolerans]